MDTKDISYAVIKRLPRYHRYLRELKEAGVERISSGELSAKMRVTASQIRQDLNHFGGFGQQGYGYNVEYLFSEISKILGLDSDHPMIILGAGNLGHTLANYSGFDMSGGRLIGGFDVDPDLRGQKIRDVEIRMMDELPAFLAEYHPEIAVLTLPKAAAEKVTDLLVANGIRAIWNFAHVDLDVPDNVIVENVHLSESLMTLSYNLSEYRKKHGEKNV